MYFALFMVIILAITGLIWLLDIFIFSKKRPADIPDPTVVEYAKSFFPVILFVFLIRSFIVEPFKIPSGSMMPTLLAGDFILVNKYAYGFRIPILNNTMIETGKPKRGDVFVFHYPPDPTIDYIKRVIGLPGDKIIYKDKKLSINGKSLDVKLIGNYEYTTAGLNTVTAMQFNEQLDTINHNILLEDRFNQDYEFEVPAGHYLAMGDNRDNSADSRIWGYVPEKNLVGKAFFIWFNFDDLGRIGSFK